MVENLTANEIYNFIVSDFKGSWDSFAANSRSEIGRGNFMFARQAMNLIEFASMLCKSDTTANALHDLSNELIKIEPRYFTTLPSPCARTTDFELPHNGNTSGNLLLWALHDLIRNGIAHQYQQIIVDLSDSKHFFIRISGPDPVQYLSVLEKFPKQGHLDYFMDADGDLGLQVHPEELFFDFDHAIRNSNLLNRGLSLSYLVRPKPTKPGFYGFDLNSLESSLIAGRHVKR